MTVHTGSAPTRILHVLEALEGGTARHIVDVVRFVDGFEHHVAIPSRRVGGETDEQAHDKLLAAGASVHLVEMRRSPMRARNAAAIFELRRLIRRVKPAVVHSHSSIGGALGRVAALRSGACRIYTPQGLSTNPVGLVAERALGMVTDYFVAASPSEARLAIDRHFARPSRLVTIPNGIERDAPVPGPDVRELLSIPAAAAIVGTISRLVPQKAPEDFVRACSTVGSVDRGVHFVLIGAGPLSGRVHDAVARLALEDRFHHVPALPDAAAVLAQFDVFVLSSRFEGAPYSALEAMRAGTPVVLTDVVGSRDIVEHDVSGVLVAPGDPPALGRAIVDVLADSDKGRRMGEAGRVRVRSQFDVRDMASALAKLYTRASR